MSLFSYIFILICCNCGAQKTENELTVFQNSKDESHLSPKFFEIMKMYFVTVTTVTIYDQLGNSGIVNEIYKCYYKYHSTTLIYKTLIINETVSDISYGYEETLSSNADTETKIPVSKRNNQGNLFLFKNTESLIAIMKIKDFIELIRNQNTMYFINEICFEENFKIISKLFKKTWQKNGVLYHIVFWAMCESIIFFDKLSYEPVSRTWGQTSIMKLKNIENVSNIFSYYFKNFKGYPIRINLFIRYPTCVASEMTNDLFLVPYLKEVEKALNFNGIDPIMLYNTFTALNFTPHVQTDEYDYHGHRTSNGSYVGSLSRVINNITDISFNGRFVNQYKRNDLIEFLRPVGFDKICFLTPKAQKIPKLKADLIETRALIALVLLIGIISCFWRRIQIAINTKYLEPVSFVIIEFCMMLVSGGLASLPKTSVQRAFVSGMLLAGLYFSGIFQAALSTAMSTVIHEKDIDTFKQLADSRLPIICSSKSLKGFLGENQSAPIEALRKQFHVGEYKMSLLAMTAYYRNASCIERAEDAKIIIKAKYSTNDGIPLVHIMKNCLRSYYISYIVRKNYPFAEDISQTFVRFREAGLSLKWYKNLVHALTHYQGENEEDNVNLMEACTLKGLSFYFYMLLLGYGLGSLVLVIELYVSKRKGRRIDSSY